MKFNPVEPSPRKLAETRWKDYDEAISGHVVTEKNTTHFIIGIATSLWTGLKSGIYQLDDESSIVLQNLIIPLIFSPKAKHMRVDRFPHLLQELSSLTLCCRSHWWVLGPPVVGGGHYVTQPIKDWTNSYKINIVKMNIGSVFVNGHQFFDKWVFIAISQNSNVDPPEIISNLAVRKLCTFIFILFWEVFEEVFLCTRLFDVKYSYLTQFANWTIGSREGTLKSTTPPSQSGLGSNANEGVASRSLELQNRSFTLRWSFVSYLGHQF